jgi:intracellular multiplication protein IcmQ
MAFKKDDEHKVRSWLAEIESILHEYDWEASFILKTCKKKLQELAVQLASYVREFEAASEDQADSKASQWDGYIPVYITLYTSNGDDLNNWLSLLRGIRESSSGRPIYRQEMDARASVDGKSVLSNEGYVKLYVSEEDIVKMPPAKIPQDRRGVALLTLRQKAIEAAKIVKFIHGNQSIYDYKNGVLTPA